jgi:ZIP family zinc transporter
VVGIRRRRGAHAGAAIGLWAHVSRRAIGYVMAFGSGVLISALAFELTSEAFDLGGADAVASGLGAGALAYFAGDAMIDRRGGDNRKRSSQAEGGAAGAIVLGAVLDGIPESAAIGLTVLDGGTVSVAVVAAVFISNVPESLSAATGLRERHSPAWILSLWAGVTVVSALAAGLGYAVMGGAGGNLTGFVQAFAGGAVLTMLADTMMPEAFEHSGKATGLLTVLGFALAFLLSSTR